MTQDTNSHNNPTDGLHPSGRQPGGKAGSHKGGKGKQQGGPGGSKQREQRQDPRKPHPEDREPEIHEQMPDRGFDEDRGERKPIEVERE